MNIDNNKLSRYELMKKEKAIVARICSDDEFAYYFFLLPLHPGIKLGYLVNGC